MFYLTWGVLLTLVAIGLGFATVRRFQAERLSQEMDSIEWPPAEEPLIEEPMVFERPLLDEIVEPPRFEEPAHYDEPLRFDEPVRLGEPDEPEEAVPASTSDVVARLRREVRSWRA
jgi:hypothetical protein